MISVDQRNFTVLGREGDVNAFLLVLIYVLCVVLYDLCVVLCDLCVAVYAQE